MKFNVGDEVVMNAERTAGYSVDNGTVGTVVRRIQFLEDEACYVSFPGHSSYGVFDKHLLLNDVTNWKKRLGGKK